MEKEFYKEIAKRCLDLGTPIHYLVRDIREAVAHEAMLSTWGDLEEAAKKVGVDKATFSTYLGMRSKEWREKYGYIIQAIKFAVAHEAMLKAGGNLREASKIVGVHKATLCSYLGMGTREWNEKHGGKK